MRFVRENLFLVVLVAIVVVVGGVMVAIDFSIADDVDAQLKVRGSVAKDLATFDRKALTDPVNERFVAAKRSRALKYQGRIKDLEGLHVGWNLRRFRILQLPIYKAREGSLLLERRDIRNWAGLLSALRAPKPKSASHKKIGEHIWQLLPADTRGKLPAPGVPPTGAQAAMLLAGLNAILQQKDFFDRSQFPRVVLPEEVEAREDEQGPLAVTAPEKAARPTAKDYDVMLPEAAGRILRKVRPPRTVEAGGQPKPRPGSGLTSQDAQRLNRLVLEAFYGEFIAPCEAPAFPIQKELYQQHSLQFHFQQEYQSAIADLLVQLGPTSAPSKDEVDLEVERWTKLKQRLEDRESLLKRRAAEREAPGRAGTGPDMPGLRERTIPRTGRRPGMGRPEVTEKEPGDEEDKAREIVPKTDGQETAKMRKAREGQVYANMDSFTMVFPPGVPETNPPDERLWQAQVSLWVMRDVITAIIRTNNQVLGKLDPADRNVLNAAVKHLEGIQVGELEDKKKKAGRPAAVELSPLEEESSRRRRSRATLEIREAGAKAESLTQRNASKEHDLTKYSFVVVMPTRHLVRLQQNLLALNYHTILKVSMAEVSEQIRKDYYYGVEPIMRVRIDAELPLLSAWTRGKWDDTANRWLTWQPGAGAAATTGPAGSRNWAPGEPLMPVDMMISGTLPPEAWRTEDWQRVRKEEMERRGIEGSQ